jgi:hypothetical protein
MLHLQVVPLSFHKLTILKQLDKAGCTLMLQATQCTNEMNDALAYEMQVQIGKPNTWGVTISMSFDESMFLAGFI